MRFCLLIVLLGVGLGVDAQFIPIFDWVRSFFGTYQSPGYLSIRNISNNIEERIYPSKFWVCHEQFGTQNQKDLKSSESFMSLHRYIQGKNVPGSNIEMTIPTLVKVDHRNGNLWSYEVCFFIPNELQAKPPKPDTSDRAVRLVKLPELHVYAKIYGGYSTQPIESEEVSVLGQVLKNNSIKYFEEREGPRATYFVAGYDSPTKFWSRRNEVWLLAQNTSKSINSHTHLDIITQ